MKNRIIAVLVLAFSSLLSGILISKMSFIGRVGITIIYNEYAILKSWWKTALLFFVIQVVLFIIFSIWQKKNVSKLKQFILPMVFLIMGFGGLYYTYHDFTETSHRLLKASFHFGFYLFWMTWFANCMYFLIIKPTNENEILEENI
ncbi:hypothetical protein [Chishuiella changwenlii]|uniref:hypothetical protein n=1 Tax=Chishuiella changwenlii TaxID=1434701 RepID=UPI002FD8C0DD